jgi:hypothetical protein
MSNKSTNKPARVKLSSARIRQIRAAADALPEGRLEAISKAVDKLRMARGWITGLEFELRSVRSDELAAHESIRSGSVRERIKFAKAQIEAARDELDELRVLPNDLNAKLFDTWDPLSAADHLLHLKVPVSGEWMTECPATTVVEIAARELDVIATTGIRELLLNLKPEKKRAA